MEDHHTIKTHYAYMLRVDLTHGSTSEALLMNWVEKFNCTAYLFGRELKQDGTHHYQGIVWFESKLSSNDACKCRNWWRNKTLATNQGHAFRSARKVTNLARYCMKEANIFTNLSLEQLESLGKWQTQAAIKLQNKEKLEELLKLHLPEACGFYHFAEIYTPLHFRVMQRLPTKQAIYNWAYKFHALDSSSYLSFLLPQYNFCGSQDNYDDLNDDPSDSDDYAEQITNEIKSNTIV